MATEVKNKWAYPTEPFGEPTLYASRNSSACWVRTPPVTVYQKSPTQWAANLYGGIQTGANNWAQIVIPVNELPIDHLAKAMWTYYMTNAESGGVNIVIWIHDPTDFSKRVEITQTMGEASKAKGFNKENLEMGTAELFAYGENTNGTGLSLDGTNYAWEQFRKDALFSTWTIYRITIDYGWLASSTLDEVWVTEIQINDTIIPLKPDSTGTGRIGRRFFTAAGTEIAVDSATLAPQTPFRLLDVKLHLNGAATQQTFTLTCDADRDSAYDTKLYSKAMAGVQDIIVPFGIGYDFYEDDEIDAKWINADGATYGITYSYQTVFEGC